MDFVETVRLITQEHGNLLGLRSAACSADSTAFHLSDRYNRRDQKKAAQLAASSKNAAPDLPHLSKSKDPVKPTLLTIPEVAEYARKANIKSPCEPGYDKSKCPEKKATQPKVRMSPGIPLFSKLHRKSEVPSGSFSYMCVCGLAGALCCGFTHLAIVPLDLIKCRIQVDSRKYPNIYDAARVTIREEGLRTMVKGWAPTATGYGMQGFAKFGLYEVFKKWYGEALGPENAYSYRTLMYLAAASSAEAVGDVFLAPFEAVKVRMQTTPGAPSTMRQMFPIIYRQEGLAGLYKGLPPLWMRQIPYTASKFVCFEKSIEWLYKNVVPKKRDECTKAEQLMVTFVAGCFAGVVCVVCSHPPDVIVSKLYKEPNATISSVVKELGVAGMWKGLHARILMIGSIAAAQLFIVDSVKVAFNLERPPPPEMPASLKRKLAAHKQGQ